VVGCNPAGIRQAGDKRDKISAASCGQGSNLRNPM